MSSEALNVLLVVLEGARVDRLSWAGSERPTTPFLDQVAREGVRFPNAFTTAPSSLAAHASILTGLFASVHGATEETRALGPSPRLLPEYLKGLGYRTAAFCPDPTVGPAAGLGRGFDCYYTARSGGRFTGRAADYARRASDRVLGRADAGARRTTQALVDWLAASREPFFAFVHYREPVRPIRPPAPYDRSFMPAGLTAAHARPANQPLDGPPRPPSAEETAVLAALHDGALRYCDLRLKQVADALAATGRWDRTLFILTASFGENLGDLGAWDGRPGLHDAALRVPLVLRCPQRIPAGFVVDEFAQSVDLLPTVAELTGCRLDAPLQGRALLTGAGATAGPAAVMAEAFRLSPSAAARVGDVRRKVIRTRREKLVWQSDEHNALFDLLRDPDERHNLAGSEPARADRLRRRLFDWLADSQRSAAANGLAPAEADHGTPLAGRSAGE